MTTVTDKSGKAIALIAFTTDITEKKQAPHELQKYCDQLKRKIAELKTTNDKLQRQITEQIIKREQTEEQLLESIIEADGPTEPIEPFNPQELKALSELAKRLT